MPLCHTEQSIIKLLLSLPRHKRDIYREKQMKGSDGVNVGRGRGDRNEKGGRKLSLCLVTQCQL